MVVEHITVSGNLLDDHSLAALLAVLDQHDVSFKVRRFQIGEKAQDETRVELTLATPTRDLMEQALDACANFGIEHDRRDAELAVADLNGVLPEDFHSTTNFPTEVRVKGQWVPVEKLEMDCGIRVWEAEGTFRAETCPMHRVQEGDRLVVGHHGVKIIPEERPEAEEDAFRFMINDVSTERPKSRLIAIAADAVREARAAGEKVLLVGGPAIIHSGCAKHLAALIEHGWVNVLFAGNALAAHDIEAAMLGTSLGINLEMGRGVPHGHTHHLRAINRVRRAGSIQAAVESGLVPDGVMATCVRNHVPYVLAGSIRDDGPLPDVITDVVQAQDAMRAQIEGVGVALMVATTLHSVATGNILPAKVRTFCVDSDADSVIKLTDRGTHQAIGIVTDAEFFVKELCRLLDVLA